MNDRNNIVWGAQTTMRLGLYVSILSLCFFGMSRAQDPRNPSEPLNPESSPGAKSVFAIWKDTSNPISDEATTAVAYEEENLEPPTASRTGSTYAIQVGAFAIKSNAIRMQRRFSDEGYRTEILKNQYGRNLLYLVWVGSFNTLEDAHRLRREIRAKHGIIGLLRERSSWKR